MLVGQGQLQVNLKAKASPLPQTAFHVECATQHFQQSVADRQPESGSAKPTTDAGIRLIKGPEQIGYRFLAHANAGVNDPKLQFGFPPFQAFAGNQQTDPAFGGEFERISEQIDQNLAQPKPIPDEMVRHIRRCLNHEVQGFFFGLIGKQVAQRMQHLVKVECAVFDSHLPRFDFGII